MSSIPTVSIDELKHFYQALEGVQTPLEPADPRYVPGLYGHAGQEPVDKLADTIAWSQSSTLNYFTGQRGTGKSTQLRNLRNRLEGEGFAVALVDMSEYVPQSEALDAVGFLISLAAAMGDFFQDRYAHNPQSESLLERVRMWLTGTDIAITGIHLEAGLPGGLGKFGFKAALSAHPTFRQKVREVSADTQQGLIEEGRKTIAAFGDALKAASGKSGAVILVDSLERLRDSVTSPDGEVTESVRRLFVDDRRHLAIGGCHMVYAVPPYLTVTANLSGLVGLTQLGSVRVFEFDTANAAQRQTRKEGIDKMREVLTRVHPDWARVISADAVALLSERSGGDLRQFLFRFVRDLVIAARPALDRLPFSDTDPAVHDLLARATVEAEQLVVDQELPLLAKMASARNSRVGSRSDDFPTLARFYENRCLLNYNNGTEWVDANPLLWDLIARFESKRDKASPSV